MIQRNDKKYNKIPKSLRERRGQRAIITVWFGILPLFIGGIGIYNFFTKKEQVFSGQPDTVFYKTECGDNIVHNDCLFFVINGDTIRALLSDSELERYFSLISFSDNILKKELKGIPDYDKSRIKLAKQKDKQRKLLEIQNHITLVKLKYVNHVVKSLQINGKQIISYKSAFLWGSILIIIGVLWIVAHLYFFIKDPYDVYNK